MRISCDPKNSNLTFPNFHLFPRQGTNTPPLYLHFMPTYRKWTYRKCNDKNTGCVKAVNMRPLHLWCLLLNFLCLIRWQCPFLYLCASPLVTLNLLTCYMSALCIDYVVIMGVAVANGTWLKSQ